MIGRSARDDVRGREAAPRGRSYAPRSDSKYSVVSPSPGGSRSCLEHARVHAARPRPRSPRRASTSYAVRRNSTSGPRSAQYAPCSPRTASRRSRVHTRSPTTACGRTACACGRTRRRPRRPLADADEISSGVILV
jgi:hypothetical protein